MAELVGILNVTPDSFSDGNLYYESGNAIQRGDELFRQGATFIDIGAESTRPGAQKLEYQEEQRRLVPLVNKANEEDWRISIDTYHPETVFWAGKLLSNFIVNDVTAFSNPIMREATASLESEAIVSHLPLNVAGDIQKAHHQKPVDSVNQVIEELEEQIEKMKIAGIKPEKIIADPGIGFGKTPELNWELLAFAEQFRDYRVMIGYSRKRFLGEKRMDLPINLEAGRIAIASGASYLRVHDVAGHKALL